jgi:phenylalanine-4-hydroxylase
LSSSGETAYSLYDAQPQRVPYNVAHIIDTPYIKDRYQEIYFVIDSFEQLYESVQEIEAQIDALVEKELEKVA